MEQKKYGFKIVSLLFQRTILPPHGYYNITIKKSEVKKMKNWKIITLATLSVVAIALLISLSSSNGTIQL